MSVDRSLTTLRGLDRAARADPRPSRRLARPGRRRRRRRRRPRWWVVFPRGLDPDPWQFRDCRPSPRPPPGGADRFRVQRVAGRYRRQPRGDGPRGVGASTSMAGGADSAGRDRPAGGERDGRHEHLGRILLAPSTLRATLGDLRDRRALIGDIPNSRVARSNIQAGGHGSANPARRTAGPGAGGLRTRLEDVSRPRRGPRVGGRRDDAPDPATCRAGGRGLSTGVRLTVEHVRPMPGCRSCIRDPSIGAWNWTTIRVAGCRSVCDGRGCPDGGPGGRSAAVRPRLTPRITFESPVTKVSGADVLDAPDRLGGDRRGGGKITAVTEEGVPVKDTSTGTENRSSVRPCPQRDARRSLLDRHPAGDVA